MHQCLPFMSRSRLGGRVGCRGPLTVRSASHLSNNKPSHSHNHNHNHNHKQQLHSYSYRYQVRGL